MTYTQNDGNPDSKASFSAADRETSLNDFGPVAYPSRSGRVYNVFGRGLYSFNSGSTEYHQWHYTSDFTNMALGYLPAGTLISIIDVDGMSINESVLLSSSVMDNMPNPWPDYFDDANNPPDPGNSHPGYDPLSNTYFF